MLHRALRRIHWRYLGIVAIAFVLTSHLRVDRGVVPYLASTCAIALILSAGLFPLVLWERLADSRLRRQKARLWTLTAAMDTARRRPTYRPVPDNRDWLEAKTAAEQILAVAPHDFGASELGVVPITLVYTGG